MVHACDCIHNSRRTHVHRSLLHAADLRRLTQVVSTTQTGNMENGVEAKRVKMDDGSLFGHLDIYPPDPIFHVKDAYLADKSPNKVNLGIGGMIRSCEKLMGAGH